MRFLNTVYTLQLAHLYKNKRKKKPLENKTNRLYRYFLLSLKLSPLKAHLVLMYTVISKGDNFLL